MYRQTKEADEGNVTAYGGKDAFGYLKQVVPAAVGVSPILSTYSRSRTPRDLAKENEKLQKKVTFYEKETQSLEQSMKQLKDKFGNEQREATTKIQTLEMTMHNERQIFEKDVNEKDKQWKEKNEQVVRHNMTLKRSNEALQREIAEERNVKIEETAAREKLKKELQDKEEMNKQLLEKLDSVQTSLVIESACKNIEQDKNSNYEKEIEKLKEKINTLLKINNTQEEKITQYQQELKLLKSKEKLDVQLICERDGDLKTTLLDALAGHIRVYMNNKQVEVEIIQCMKASEIQPDIPLLLMCFNSHGRSANVTQLLKSIHVSSKVAVLIFHIKAPHALPQEASDRVLVEVTESYPRLGGIFDLAFMPEEGIYKCEMNDKNLVSITNFINRVGVRQRATLQD